MVVKIYISGISGNKEVKKRQQRVGMILDSKHIKYELVDIAEPGNESDKDYMQANSTSLGATIGDANPKYPLPPQLFNDTEYCGDYEKFDLSNEIDELDKFLKLTPEDTTVTSSAEVKITNVQETVNAVMAEAEEKSAENNEAEAAIKNGDDNELKTEEPQPVVENGDDNVISESTEKNPEPDDAAAEEDDEADAN